ncbi:MAG: carboxypeptidase regulatory-like domain-containing protein, partial [Victivallales bacterium]|nr:carboxypeptidase regulatory-like domain-containing protein [Victivallales bacterium]
MKAIWRITLGIVLCHWVLLAQPALDEGTLRELPLADALVLDPGIGWRHSVISGSEYTPIAMIEPGDGAVRATVVEPGKRQSWQRQLLIPVDLRTHAFAIIAYRATGLAASDHELLSLYPNRQRALLLNRDAICDGEVHEVVVELAELEMEREMTHLGISPHCEGPEPAVFELLALRFEADGQPPPRDNGPAPEFSFQVVDREGQPIQGATVTLDAAVLNAARSDVSGPDGKVTIRGVPTSGERHMVRVTKEGMAPTEVKATTGDDLPTKLVLLKGTSYGGVVRDEDGEPVENVSVAISGASADGTPRGRHWYVRMLTDGDGRFLSPVLPEEKGLPWLEVHHPDYLGGHMRPKSAQDLRKGTADIVIPRGGTVRGKVLSPDGRPLPGATVRYTRRGAVAMVETDQEGEFLLRCRRPGANWLVVQHDSYAPVEQRLDVPAEGAETVIRLEPPRRLDGRVVDLDGKPVKGARIRVDQWRRLSLLSWHATTDRQGAFSWAAAPADTVYLHVERHGHLELSRYPVRATDQENTVVFPPMLRIAGKVTDAKSGRPLAGCQIGWGTVPGGWQSAEEGQPEWRRQTRKTNARGRFEAIIGHAQYGHQVVLKVEKGGYAPVLSHPFPLDRGKQTFDLALATSEDIRGTILLPNGKPAAAAMVYLVTPGNYMTIMEGPRVPFSKAAHVKTEADGRYRFPCALGNWRLVAFRPEGYAEIGSKSFAAPGNLVLQPWGRLQGICNRNGKPYADCRIELRPYPPWHDPNLAEVQFHFSATTDDAGRFLFAHVPGGQATVYCCPPGSTGAHRAPSREQAVTVASGQTSRVEFGASGRPVVGQFALAEGVPGDMTWETKSGKVSPRFPHLGAAPKIPPNWSSLSGEAKTAWSEGPKGRAYREAQKQYGEAV